MNDMTLRLDKIANRLRAFNQNVKLSNYLHTELAEITKEIENAALAVGVPHHEEGK